MSKAASYVAAFLAGILVALLGAVLLQPARAESAPTPIVSFTPSPEPSKTPFPTEAPTVTPLPTKTRMPAQAAVGGMQFGWKGQVQCFNCSPFSARVKLTHYDPQRGKINCWKYSDKFKYCISPTWIGVPWDAVWGFGAACDASWVIGTWIEIPGVGSFICMDHGSEITCDQKTGVCNVDLLGPGGADWDGKTVDVTLWVPTSYLLRLQEDQ